ncbi:hypothetical protein phi9181_ORF062 [Enterococcus phage 9181]|nr:hypothetical protein phi9181_ORF062 [Enterococcus phage 9181]
MLNLFIFLSLVKGAFILFAIISVIAVIGIFAMSQKALETKIKELKQSGGKW